MNFTKTFEQRMQDALQHLETELKSLRTGRAHPALVEEVRVEIYGTQMRLKDVANITTPESRQLLIAPYDAQNTASIGKAIQAANIGLNPIVDANTIRINIPPMDGTMRQKMTKTCHEFCEKSKVQIRQVRRDANEMARKQKNDNTIGEDLLKKLEKEIQELTDKYCHKCDEVTKKKETEISTV